MSFYRNYHDNERIRTASNACRLDNTVPIWSAELFTPDFLDLDFPVFENATFPQNFLEPAQPFPPFIGENLSWQTPLDSLSVQAVDQNSFPSLISPLGFPTFYPQITARPVYDVWNNCYEGVPEAKMWLTGDVHPSAVLPAIPPSISTFPANWIKVPQRCYDHGSKQLDFKRLEPICFGTMDRPGINLRDALRKDFTRLHGQDDPMLRGASGGISCRLLFPGYPDNGSSCQIHMQDWTKARKPITRRKLAHEVARKLDRYLTQLTRTTPDGTVDDCWTVGHGFMRIENMFLVGLESVSKGSFQPEIWVEVPSVPHVPTSGDGN